MGAMRPQTPHRSPRQAFGGDKKPCLWQDHKKIAPIPLLSLHDYMPAIRGLLIKFNARPLTLAPRLA
jgi:hypothetical protein